MILFILSPHLLVFVGDYRGEAKDTQKILLWKGEFRIFSINLSFSNIDKN